MSFSTDQRVPNWECCAVDLVELRLSQVFIASSSGKDWRRRTR